ncbi:hypothetical protein OQA88_11667 [Cercophora sp. LCS_1]
MGKNTVKEPFFLLDEVERLDNDLLQSLLGLAVHRESRPIQGDHAPKTRGDDALKARDAIDSLYPPQPTYIKDVKLMMGSTKSRRAQLKLETLVRGALNRDNKQNVALEAASFRRISMRAAPSTVRELLAKDKPLAKPATATEPAVVPTAEPNSFFGALSQGIQGIKNTLGLADEDPAEVERRQQEKLNEQEMNRRKYRDQVLRLLESHRELGILISFITCTDMTKETNVSKLRAAELGAGLPKKLAAVGGVPIDVAANVGASSSQDVAASGTYEGEYLIACSYLRLDYKDQPSNFVTSLWSSSKPKSEAQEIDFRLGKEAAWRLGVDPLKGGYAAPMAVGGGSVSGGDDNGADDGEDAFSVVLLHPEDRLGENTGENEEDDTEDESDDDEYNTSGSSRKSTGLGSNGVSTRS